ncbi:hypothetical protein CFP56_036187 [Quercus suber]|uniref:Uncharacterized protein n=1 Tax=Quercus suber TaxID=58331 RepID=A0AAW0J927_QUESU
MIFCFNHHTQWNTRCIKRKHKVPCPRVGQKCRFFQWHDDEICNHVVGLLAEGQLWVCSPWISGAHRLLTVGQSWVCMPWVCHGFARWVCSPWVSRGFACRGSEQ